MQLQLFFYLQVFTANTLYRKFEKNIPRNDTARPRSQFDIPVSVSDRGNI
jgi:hypothetical protein